MHDREECQHITKDFVKLGLDVETIIGSGYPSFIFGSQNSLGSALNLLSTLNAKKI